MIRRIFSLIAGISLVLCVILTSLFVLGLTRYWEDTVYIQPGHGVLFLQFDDRGIFWVGRRPDAWFEIKIQKLIVVTSIAPFVNLQIKRG